MAWQDSGTSSAEAEEEIKENCYICNAYIIIGI
jgi:hypothetical protein